MSKHYAICENMCIEETYSKKEIDEKLSNVVILEIDVKDEYGNGKEILEPFEAGNINDYYVVSVMIDNKESNYRLWSNQPFVSSKSGTNLVGIDEFNVKLSEYGIKINYHFDTQVSEVDPVDFKIILILQNKTGAKIYEYAG